MLNRLWRSVGLAVVLASLTSGAFAQAAYPNRLITIVLPFAPGGASDIMTRFVGEYMKQKLGQSVIAENRPGASGNLGAETVYRAAPDGYTLLTAPQLSFSVNHLTNPTLRFDPQKFEPVSVLATYPYVLFARADLPANTFAELIDYVRANPGKLNYASPGVIGMGHLAMEAIKLREKVDIVHVPYRGTALALTDLAAGHVDLLIDSMIAAGPHVESGKIKILAVGGEERMPAYPNVATIAEKLPGLHFYTWMAIAAPPGTPKAITQLLSTTIAEALKTPEAKEVFKSLQVDPFGSTPDEMASLIKEGYETWAPVITKLGIKAD
ncbi:MULTISPECIES: tripartite tricarboxylate transporter substrate binding protein [unclassified Beijerinckia]|uniref:Bug family tripartite tricarboxylate transporter substrate binding protein n=1 Tax=unclassified Beijerinckia TaxID=2638183 RepID=UPI0008973402|nr:MULTISPECIES: tripartite tricarboxylate transporter substrate binding protein [unclassified Beijerinckia]MDH7795210.1 tripartite-type tricarboxylate transporter receptor subunit TctC [Beijerinckia sp. GAS462]SEB92170.1 Tripartite-type tricarboxylate transporter, receptor component TctC [Beijerinckia sp. 28-YEA-48]